MVEGAKAKVKPIVKVDVHAPIFCFPKFNMPEWRKDDSLWVSNVETYLIRSGAVTEKDCVKVKILPLAP